MSKYPVVLSDKDRESLEAIVSRGSDKARVITRARVLILLADGTKTGEIMKGLSTTRETIHNIRRRFFNEGLRRALYDAPRPGAPTIFDGNTRAKLTALACSESPDGKSQWALRLLADKAVELDLVDSISHTQVRRILKKTRSNRT